VPDRAVGVDVGGTKIAAGVVDADGGLHRPCRRPTPDDAAALIREGARLAGELDDTGAPVGVGVAGFVDLGGTVRAAPNLPALNGWSVQDRLADALGVPVTVCNDADGAAWGELHGGAGRGLGSLAMLTVGTGVGGGLVLHGRLVRGAQGAAGELGHMIVDEGGPACPCGNRGCLEAHASGRAIARKARERRDAGQLAAGSALDREGLRGEDVAAAANEGDADALAVLADAGFWLGVGAASIANAVDPPLVVVGGGAAEAGELLLEPARRACADRVLGVGLGGRESPALMLGELGAHAGLIGAGLLALQDTGG
jgi:glucokinase